MEAAFARVQHAYDLSLRWALAHKPFVAATFAVMLAATVFLAVVIPKGFMPDEDTGQILMMTEGPQGASFDWMQSHHQQLADIIRHNSEVQSVMSSVGIGQGSPNLAQNQGRLLVVLKRTISKMPSS